MSKIMKALYEEARQREQARIGSIGAGVSHADMVAALAAMHRLFDVSGASGPSAWGIAGEEGPELVKGPARIIHRFNGN